MDLNMVPESLRWIGKTDAARAWLSGLPRLMEECEERWSLRLGPPYPGSYVSLVVPADLPDGTGAVLKIQFPHRESEHEADALALWDGEGAVRLLDHDPSRHALLIERCDPGRHLSELEPDAALGVLIDLLPRLLKPAGQPFNSLKDEAARWAEQLPAAWERAGYPFERRLIDSALEALDELSGSQGEQVLLHQDLHPDNVLAAEREPWLVIDPKPLRGEREFSAAPIVRAYELGHDRDLVLGRLDRLTDELGLDRDRAVRWALAQTLAWAFEGDLALPRHVETARWLQQLI